MRRATCSSELQSSITISHPRAQEKRRHTRGSDRPFGVTAGVIRIALPRFQELLRRTGLKEEAEI